MALLFLLVAALIIAAVVIASQAQLQKEPVRVRVDATQRRARRR